ncbi:29313_t:CDS:2, partial [Gigaspora margarita]
QSCQKKDYPNHVLDCPRRSADILVKNVFQNLMPTNIAVLYEYGFENCNNTEDRTKLLGLYIGLINIIGCSASQVHSWWESGELSINIKKTYDDGGYTIDKFLSFAKPYLSKHDQTVSFKSLPESKRNVSFLYTSVIQGFVPRIEERNWIDFGFCTCESISKEYQLRDLYQELIVQRGCKIDEFNDAYMSGTVLDLLKKKINNCGWLSESKIEIFGYEQPIKSVYHLKQYVLSKSVDLIPYSRREKTT